MTTGVGKCIVVSLLFVACARAPCATLRSYGMVVECNTVEVLHDDVIMLGYADGVEAAGRCCGCSLLVQFAFFREKFITLRNKMFVLLVE